MFEYQEKGRYFAQIAEGIKEIGAQELSVLGAWDVSPAYGGLYFNADRTTLCRINYCSRLVSRVLAPLLSFRCRSKEQLYRMTRQMNWSGLISLKSTFAVFGNVSNSRINNSHYASLCVKDAIADAFRQRYGKRPDVDSRDPDIWLNIFIQNDWAVISLDTSGGSLHRRGYRKDSQEAPMQETVAAAIIAYTGWDGTVPLHDPMCGSGTLLCEALMQYCRMPSGILRKHFGFEAMPDHDKHEWQRLKKEIDIRIRELPSGCISGSDASPEAVKMARSNLKALPFGEKVKITTNDFMQSEGLQNGIIVTNPPYGIRMGDREDLGVLYKAFGDFLKQKCTGTVAYVYFGERELIKKIGLRPAWKKPLKTGGLDGRLVKYELF